MRANAPTALIADDEPHLAEALKKLLLALWPALSIVAMPRNGLEAAQAITDHEPDIAFLDIQMPGLTGLEVAQGIEGRTRVVFVTAFDQYAIDAFDHAAVDYVLKPVKAERLARAVDRLKTALAQPTPSNQDSSEDAALAAALKRLLPAATGQAPLRWIRASVGELTHQIDVQEVLYFEADEKYTVVRTTSGAEHLIRTPIVELAAQLDAGQFWQIHRSTLINVNHLAGTRRDEASRLFVRMKNHARELPVSRAYVPLFKAM
jgi:DNA-binding LytR/AlgR family response regulator